MECKNFIELPYSRTMFRSFFDVEMEFVDVCWFVKVIWSWWVAIKQDCHKRSKRTKDVKDAWTESTKKKRHFATLKFNEDLSSRSIVGLASFALTMKCQEIPNAKKITHRTAIALSPVNKKGQVTYLGCNLNSFFVLRRSWNYAKERAKLSKLIPSLQLKSCKMMFCCGKVPCYFTSGTYQPLTGWVLLDVSFEGHGGWINTARFGGGRCDRLMRTCWCGST